MANAKMLLAWCDQHGNIDQEKIDLFRPEELQKALAQGANVNARDKHGRTALMVATFFWPDAPAVQYLLKHGADVNAKDQYGNTALMAACDWGFSDIVKLLVANGADVNAKDRYGNTALMETSQADIAHFLLSHGAKVNAKAVDGTTALMRTATYGPVLLLNLLLEHGANVNATDKSSHTALAFAEIRSDQDGKQIVKMLKAAGAIHGASGAHKLAARHLSLSPQKQKQANSRLISLWSDSSGYLDIGTVFEMTPRAIYQALEAGADVNTRDKQGHTAIIAAASRGDTDRTNVLLADGANINSKDNEGQTALSVAAEGTRMFDLGSNLVGYSDLVTLLLERGAHVNAKDKAGVTALAVASRTGEINIVKILLDHGADANLADNHGTTPLMAALEGPQVLIVTNATMTLNGLQIAGNTEIIRLLLAHGAKVNSKDKQGMTALGHVLSGHIAWFFGEPSFSKEEKAAMDIAKRQHRAEIIKMLQAAGAKG